MAGTLKNGFLQDSRRVEVVPIRGPYTDRRGV